MSEYNLKGKVALITGAGQGIGKAAALVFAKSGADVILCARNAQKLEDTAKQARALGVRALPISLDVRDIDSINAAVEKGANEMGHIDVLVNAAGICIASKLVDMNPDVWDDIIGTNLRGATFMAKAVVKQMIEKKIRGTIIFVSSQAAKMGEFGNSAYGSSKIALHNLSQCMALELSQYGINTVAVCPGAVNTEMLQGVFVERGPINNMTAEEYKAEYSSHIPQGRLCEPDEMGRILAFLASDDGAYITGVTLTVAGGQTII